MSRGNVLNSTQHTSSYSLLVVYYTARPAQAASTVVYWHIMASKAPTESYSAFDRFLIRRFYAHSSTWLNKFSIQYTKYYYLLTERLCIVFRKKNIDFYFFA